ncbi:hypothetical protein [Zobellia roscoffensis]
MKIKKTNNPKYKLSNFRQLVFGLNRY